MATLTICTELCYFKIKLKWLPLSSNHSAEISQVILVQRWTLFFFDCLRNVRYVLCAQLSSNLGVTSGRKRLSRLGIADLISAKEFLVDRDAFIYLDRYVHLNAIIKSRNYGFLDIKDGWIYWEHGMEPSNFMALRSTHEPGVICELILCLVLSSQLSFSIPLEI